MSTFRKQKINVLLRDKVGAILEKELDLEGDEIVTVTRAEVADDLRQAKIFFSVFPFSAVAQVIQQLERQIYFFQQALNNQLRIYPVPRISFVLDKQEVEAAKTDKLLDSFKK